jgi:AcrR family transcriptional regulator
MEQTKKTKWQEKREASLEALVHSAMRQFHERGYAATRIEDIVNGTGYTSGAFYFHFKNKADCFSEVIALRDRLRGEWPDEVLEGLDAANSSLEAVLEKLFARFAATEAGISAWVLIMVDFHQQTRNDPEIQADLAETYRYWHHDIARFVRGLQRGGWVGAHRDPDLLASQVFAYTEGLIVHSNLYQLDRPGLMDGLLRLFAD